MSEPVSPVAFHTGVVDPAGHALRLVRKAMAAGSRVLLIAPAPVVRELDERLWTDDPGSFIPHAVWSPASRSSGTVRHAHVWLWSASNEVDEAESVPEDLQVLINLGVPVPLNARRFLKVIELVSASPQARVQGQQRWRTWREWGISPTHHAFS